MKPSGNFRYPRIFPDCYIESFTLKGIAAAYERRDRESAEFRQAQREKAIDKIVRELKAKLGIEISFEELRKLFLQYRLRKLDIPLEERTSTYGFCWVSFFDDDSDFLLLESVSRDKAAKILEIDLSAYSSASS